MKKRQIFLILAASAVLTVSSACSSYAPPPAVISRSSFTDIPKGEHQKLKVDGKYLTLEEAQNTAVRNNPSFRAQYHAVSAARAAYYAAFAPYLPSINLGYSMYHTVTDQAKYSSVNFDSRNLSSNVTASASWLVFDSFAREMNLLAAKHGWKQSEALELDARRLLMQNVAYAYNNVLLAREKIRIAQEDMKFQNSQLRESELKFEVGSVTLSDVLNFKAYYNSAESDLYTAQYNLAAYKYSLAVLMGLTEGKIPDDVKFPGMLSNDGEILSPLPVYLDMALANRPDLKAYREALEVAKYNYWSSICAFGPTATFSAELGYGDTRRNSNTPDSRWSVSKSSTFSMTYGFNVSWNVFNGGATFFNMRARQANMFQTDFQLANTWITVISEVRTAYDYYLTALKQVKISQKNVEITRKIRDLVDEEYRAGNTELVRLNEAQRDLVSNETTLASFIIEMHNAKAKLTAVIGGY